MLCYEFGRLLFKEQETIAQNQNEHQETYLSSGKHNRILSDGGELILIRKYFSSFLKACTHRDTEKRFKA